MIIDGKRIGRPPKPAAELRNRVITVCVTGEEHDRVKAKAGAQNETVSELVRGLLGIDTKGD